MARVTGRELSIQCAKLSSEARTSCMLELNKFVGEKCGKDADCKAKGFETDELSDKLKKLTEGKGAEAFGSAPAPATAPAAKEPPSTVVDNAVPPPAADGTKPADAARMGRSRGRARESSMDFAGATSPLHAGCPSWGAFEM